MLDKVVNIDVRGLRVAGVAMVGAAAIWPLFFPHGVGPPCPLRTLTGIPCPSCGMTTSVVATVHGDLSGAVVANPFGPVAVVAAVALLCAPKLNVLRVPIALIVVMGALSWMFQLHRFGFL